MLRFLRCCFSKIMHIIFVDDCAHTRLDSSIDALDAAAHLPSGGSREIVDYEPDGICSTREVMGDTYDERA
jgi:hypothetical protein